ncbi:MAG: UDP-N-acetylmuramate--L-alanine ligase [Planctomycetes bacterium]|nr:UDP-N-acetylmuramate--L-alanine ligase [Planctomycetota bacterium]
MMPQRLICTCSRDDWRARQVEQTYAGQRIHMIGIGGAGMCALAEMLLQRGATVSGSDLLAGIATDRLGEAGAEISIGHQVENIPDRCDRVVYSAAVCCENPELLAAAHRGIERMKYSQMLGELLAAQCGVAIAGTHGKSTTTAMVAYAMVEADLDPSFIIGATAPQLGGPSLAGSGRYFVAEACEFDRNFLSLRPTLAAVLNIEEDHLDCYKDIAGIIEAFGSFLAKIPVDGLAVVNGEDRNVAAASRSAVCEVQTFGTQEGCMWRAVDLQADRGAYSFTVTFAGWPFCRIALSLPGLHNVYNALAACAILHHAALAPRQIASALGSFEGTLRRMTVKAQSRGVTVVDDYAHHPTEIQVTLRALRERFSPKRLVCVFQPHQHSRTRFLLADFSRSFAAADIVIVPDIFFVRDSVREKDYISSKDLAARIRLHGGQAIYLETFEAISSHLKEIVGPGDLVVTMGAGNVWEIADEIVRWLGVAG